MKTQEQNHPPVLERINGRSGRRLHERVDTVRASAARAAGELGEGMDKIAIRFKKVRGSVLGKTKRYSKATQKYVTKNPWKAVGISAGVAFLMGMVIGRRGDDGKS